MLTYDPQMVLAALACSVTAYVVGLAVYRLFIHPLARFPGPRLSALTKWYEFYFDIVKQPGGQFFLELKRMHAEHGPIVRPNPDEIHIDDPSFVSTLYTTHPHRRHKYAPAAKMAGLELSSYATIDHNHHRRRRNAYARMLSKQAVASAQDMIRDHLDGLVGVFQQHRLDGQPLELTKTFLALFSDVVNHFLLDHDPGYLRDPAKTEEWHRSMMAVAQATPLNKQLTWLNRTMLGMPHWVLEMTLSRLAPEAMGLLDAHKLLDTVVNEYVAQRKTEQGVKEQLQTDGKMKPRTVFHAIEGSSLPEGEKTAARLKHEGLALVMAGGDTTAKVMAHTVFQLVRHPELLEKIRAEVEAVSDGSGELPDIKVLEGLPWMRASVRESLRLRALITSRAPLVLETDVQYKQWNIPAGTAISMSQADVSHNELLFPEPLEFKPERWFDASEAQNRLFMAFGKGSRMCSGFELAYVMMYMTLATIAPRFDLRLFETQWERDVKHTRDCFLGQTEPSSRGIRVTVVGERT